MRGHPGAGRRGLTVVVAATAGRNGPGCSRLPGSVRAEKKRFAEDITIKKTETNTLVRCLFPCKLELVFSVYAAVNSVSIERLRF